MPLFEANRKGHETAENTDVPKRPDRQKHRIPDDFEPKREGAVAYWRRKGRDDLCADIEDQIAQFTAHHRKLGSRFIDWDSAWVTWYSRAVEMTRPPPQSHRQEAKILSVV